jgi:hypothetical protein
MIKIKPYEFTDRFVFEKLVKASYQSKNIEPPDSETIVESIGFFKTFPQCGAIYLIYYKNNPIGYSVVLNLWKIGKGKISYEIDELYIDRNYTKYNPEVNLIEYLYKKEKVYSIEIKIDKLKASTKKIFNLLKFDKIASPLYIKLLQGE